MNEWTSLVKSAVVIMVLLLAIGVVIFLAFLGLNAANRGGDNLAANLGTLDRRAFESYNNTQVNGTAVMNAIGRFRDQPVAVIVRTRMNGTDVATGAHAATNYAARLGPNAPGHGWGAAGGGFNLAGGWLADQGIFRPGIGAAAMTVERDVQFNNTNQAQNPASPNFINPNGNFRAALIIDINEQVIGVVFEQTPHESTWFVMP